MFLSNTLNNAQPNGGGPLIRRIITAFLGVMTITQASADSADKKDNVLDARIHVAVSTFRNESGALGRLLFAGALGFPDDESKSIGRTRSSISPNGTACCDFINLSPGDYAVVVMHDENKNGALDKTSLESRRRVTAPRITIFPRCYLRNGKTPISILARVKQKISPFSYGIFEAKADGF